MQNTYLSVKTQSHELKESEIQKELIVDDYYVLKYKNNSLAMNVCV